MIPVPPGYSAARIHALLVNRISTAVVFYRSFTAYRTAPDGVDVTDHQVTASNSLSSCSPSFHADFPWKEADRHRLWQTRHCRADEAAQGETHSKAMCEKPWSLIIKRKVVLWLWFKCLWIFKQHQNALLLLFPLSKQMLEQVTVQSPRDVNEQLELTGRKTNTKYAGDF